MTRQHTLLSQRVAQARASPAKKPRTHTPVARTLPFFKSPMKPGGGAHLNGVGGARRASRFLMKIPALPTIQEEEEGEDTTYVAPGTRYRAVSSRAKPSQVAGWLDEHESAEGMEWDGEATLIALLQDDCASEDDPGELEALVDKLKAPMEAQSRELRRYMAETTLPVMRRVKEVHDAMEDEVDLAYGTGLLAFDEVCKGVEGLALRTEDETRTAYNELQKEVRGLMTQLQDAYRHRDNLWTELDEQLESCATRARTAIEAVPEAIEQTITRLEKKNQEMEKNASSQTAKHKMLKELLGRL